MKTCLACGTNLVGRVDKKFCDHNCRNSFHNDRYRSGRKYVQIVNRNLARNYKILDELSSSEIVEVNLPIIQAMGFKPEYFTSRVDDPDEGVLFFVYDLCYQQSESDIIIKVRELQSYRDSA